MLIPGQRRSTLKLPTGTGGLIPSPQTDGNKVGEEKQEAIKKKGE